MGHVNDHKWQALIDQGYGPQPSVLLDNLVSWWSMDEASGTRVDLHSGYDLTEVNGPISNVAGKVANAAQTVSASQHRLAVSSASSPNLNFGNSDFTIMTWARRDAAIDNYPICGKWQVNGTASYMLNFEIGQAGVMRWIVNTTSAFEWVDAAATGIGTFNCFIGYYDSTAQQIGISINNGAFNTFNTAGTVVTGTSDFAFNHYGTGSYGSMSVDETAVYSAVVTAEQRNAFYNSGNGTGYPG